MLPYREDAARISCRTKTVSRHTKTANPAQSTDEEQTRNSRVACRKNQETQLLTSSSVPARLDHPCQCQAHGAWCPARATDIMRAPLEHPFWHKVQDTHECSPTNETNEIGSGHVLLQILQRWRWAHERVLPEHHGQTPTSGHIMNMQQALHVTRRCAR